MLFKAKIELGDIDAGDVFDEDENKPRHNGKNNPHNCKGDGLFASSHTFGVTGRSQDFKATNEDHNKRNNADQGNDSFKDITKVTREILELCNVF